MSNPYGGNPYGNSGDQNPYGGAGGQNPYGGSGGQQNPYGAPYQQPGYGAPQQPVKTDGVSIASFILSLLCCTGLIGLILGFVGLSRTKGGQRKGRGFAIAGVVLGALGVLAGIGFGVFIAFFASQVVSPGDAKVGQCVNLKNDSDTNTVLMTKADCTSDHDAEIVGTATVTSDNLSEIEDSMAGYCAQAIDDADFAKLADYIDKINAVIEDPNDVSVGDHLVCYVEDKRSDPIL